MVLERMYDRVRWILEAHKGLDVDKQAALIAHYLQDQPILGGLILDIMVERGQLEIVDDGDQISYSPVASPAAK